MDRKPKNAYEAMKRIKSYAYICADNHPGVDYGTDWRSVVEMYRNAVRYLYAKGVKYSDIESHVSESIQSIRMCSRRLA